jgi:hypothetical protein
MNGCARFSHWNFRSEKKIPSELAVRSAQRRLQHSLLPNRVKFQIWVGLEQFDEVLKAENQRG